MAYKITFNKEEVERLYLTYQKNPKNYGEIKKRLFGANAQQEFKKNIRSRLFFWAALTFITMVSSCFSYFTEHWGSLGAIWIIWAAFSIGIGISLYLAYKESYLVLKSNEAFFQEFEQIASENPTLDDFRIDWNTLSDYAQSLPKSSSSNVTNPS